MQLHLGICHCAVPLTDTKCPLTTEEMRLSCLNKLHISSTREKIYLGQKPQTFYENSVFSVTCNTFGT